MSSMNKGWDPDSDVRSMVRWRQVQGYLLLTAAVSPATLFFGLNLKYFLMIWTLSVIGCLGAWYARVYYRGRVPLDD